MHLTHSRVAALLLALAAVALAGVPGAAQEIRGVALEAGSDRPIEGAFITLLGRDGAEAASALTGSDGAFLLRAPHPGTYRLRVERIGYASWTSDAFRTGYGPAVPRRLRVPVRAVSLDALSVDVEGTCGERAGAGPALARAWEEARKALEVTRWTERRTGIGFELRRWTRALEPETERVLEEETSSAGKRAWRTFVSAPADELSARGYLRRDEDGGLHFFAPDAEVLLSDVFAADHCFSLVRGEDEHQGFVGLAFEPVPDRRTADVEGTLWLDPSTSELRHLAFAYTNARSLLPLRRFTAGGRVEFARLPSGHWFVRRWHVRMPVTGHRTGVGLSEGPGGGPLRPRRQTVLARVREVGGEVVRAELPDGRALDLAAWGAVEGTVRDAVPAAPAAGVQVELAGTAYRGRTDPEGRFRIAPVPPGEYTLRVRRPEAALLGAAPLQRTVSVRAERPVRVELELPSLAAAAVELCRETGFERVGEGAVALGFVRAAGSGEPAPGARVWIADRSWALRGRAGAGRVDVDETWTGVAVEADDAGAYLACGLPVGELLLAQAGTVEGASDTVRARPAPGELLRLDFELAEGRRPLARFDLPGETPDVDAVVEEILAGRAEDGAEPGTATLVGTVTSAETGEPVAGARVRLPEAAEERVTGPDGAFVVEGLPRARYRVVTEHLGMASDTARVDLRRGSGQVAVFTLETRPIELPSLEVEVERTFHNPRLAGFYGRMARGTGDYITREDLEQVDVVGAFRRRVPFARITTCVAPGGLRVSGCWELAITRGAVSERSLLDGPAGACPPLVYVDGHLLPSTDAAGGGRRIYGTNAFSTLQGLPRDLLEGIEVYRNPATAPGEYRALGDACGIVLVWTRGR